LIRRHAEELRIRLEQDLSRLIQDLETNKNDRIRELKKTGSELEELAVELEGRSRQLDGMAASGTPVGVVGECARRVSMGRVDPLSRIAEPPVHVQPQFVASSLLRNDDNLLGRLATHDETGESDVSLRVPSFAVYMRCLFDCSPLQPRRSIIAKVRCPHIWNSLPHLVTGNLDVIANTFEKKLRTFHYTDCYP